MNEPKITRKTFTELSKHELYDILALRTNVFVVEQECAYPELDFYDQGSHHIMIHRDECLVAYARILPPDSVYKEPSIGRIVVKSEFRNKGLARLLFENSLNLIRELFPHHPVKLQAQTYLEKFYGDYGFERVSEPYPDFGIMHVDMIAKA